MGELCEALYPTHIVYIAISIIGLTLAGSASPLLTFAYLWQVKEWRIDRLREHMRAEGALRQSFGCLRPLILLFYFTLFTTHLLDKNVLLSACLGIFALLTCIQILLHKQPKPVWTVKAVVLVVTATLITLALALPTIALAPTLLPVLILIHPLTLGAAWMIFQPLDQFLKRRIMQRAKQLRAQFSDLTVIGITGSAGKTTTKELLAHILADKNTLTTPAHVNSEMGVSKWIIQKLSNKETEPEILIVEMGAYCTGEISLLCDIAQPTIGAVTFIGSQHIALFGSQNALYKAKGELIAALPADGHAFLNKDSEMCAKLAENAPCPVTTIGTGGVVDLEAFDVEETADGISFRIGTTIYTVPLRGTHNVTNAMLAIAIAMHLGMDEASIAKKLKSFAPPAHTFNARSEGGVTILDDTHNASPASFRAAMAWAQSQPAKHKILLTNGLIELGPNQDRIHTEMGALAAPIFDDVIFLSKRSAKPFGAGYGKQVTMYRKSIILPPETLLVCVGRMPQSTISNLIQS